MRSPDKLKIFYLQYYNIYAYQTWQSGYIQEEPSFNKFTSTLSRGLVSGLSYTMVGLECKLISRHRFVVLLLVLRHNFSVILGNSEQKYAL